MNEAKETVKNLTEVGETPICRRPGAGRCARAPLPLTTDAAFMAHAHRLKAAISECAVHP